MPQASDLRQAVIDRDIERVTALLESDPWLVVASTTNPDNETALHVAAELGLDDIAALLLARKAQIGAEDDYGRTPLHRAVWAGRASTLRLLIENGAEPVGDDKARRTILQPPDAPLSDEVWRVLMDTISIHQACALGDVEMVRQMLERNPELVSARDRDDDAWQYTPLHWAVYSGQLSLVEMLLDRGADIDAMDGGNHTPLLDAIEGGNEPMIALLRARGAWEPEGGW